MTDSFNRITRTKRSDMLNRGLFEIFHENPGEQQDTIVKNLSASLARVIQTKTSNKMDIQKYDLKAPGNENVYEERYWSVINSPIFGKNGELTHIIHKTEDVTEFINFQRRKINLSKTTQEPSTLSSDFLIETALKLAHEKLHQSEEANSFLINPSEESQDHFLLQDSNSLESQKERILVIEDNPELLQFLLKLLKPFYQVEVAQNGLEGLEKCFQFKPNLILCELNIPKMDGNTILNKIRSFPELNQSLFIFITENAEDILRFQFFRKGLQDYIIKPFQAEVILTRVQNLLALRKVQDLKILDSVLENALDCVLGVNNFGVITHWNSQAEKTFGWTKVEAIGQPMADMIIPISYRQQHRNGFNQFLNTGYGRMLNKRLELEGLKKDGTIFPIELTVTPVKSRGHFIFYGFIRDITERVRVLGQLQQAKNQAESANDAKSAFVANMSHEIRSPLAAILGFAELLTDPNIDDESQANFNAAIKRNGELLLNLINEILDLSKVESGKLNVIYSNCILQELISDVVATLSMKASQKGIKLSVCYGQGIPTIINTDTLRLKQILLNIIGNAIKFTDQGGVEIILSKAIEKNQISHLVFTIKDSGIGISINERDKLFQPFSQADTSSTRKFGGTGLGLVLSKRFANLLGGDIILSESQKGKGSTFIITIDPRLAQVPSNKTLGAPSTLLKSPSYPQSAPIIKGIKILLVEDSPDNQFLISQILKKAGAFVEIADNGLTALEKTRSGPFDIFIIDIQMPIMDGYATVKELHKNGIKAPMIALTANALQEDRERCLMGGFNEHISKPVNRNTLLNIVAQFCLGK